MVVLDIATKIIDKNTSIWVVFPGRGRRLLLDFTAGYDDSPLSESMIGSRS